MKKTNMNPLNILREAIKSVPSVKYALGVAGVASVVAILSALKLDLRVAVFGTIITFLFMVVLVVFSHLAKASKKELKVAIYTLIYFSLILLIIVSTLMVSSVFFKKPVNLQHWLGASTETNNNKKVIISGRILDKVNNRPLGQAAIRINNINETYYTSDNGNFSIEIKDENLDEKRLTFSLSKPGYQKVNKSIIPPAESLLIYMRKRNGL